RDDRSDFAALWPEQNRTAGGSEERIVRIRDLENSELSPRFATRRRYDRGGRSILRRSENSGKRSKPFHTIERCRSRSRFGSGAASPARRAGAVRGTDLETDPASGTFRGHGR